MGGRGWPLDGPTPSSRTESLPSVPGDSKQGCYISKAEDPVEQLTAPGSLGWTCTDPKMTTGGDWEALVEKICFSSVGLARACLRGCPGGRRGESRAAGRHWSGGIDPGLIFLCGRDERGRGRADTLSWYPPRLGEPAQAAY